MSEKNVLHRAVIQNVNALTQKSINCQSINLTYKIVKVSKVMKT